MSGDRRDRDDFASRISGVRPLSGREKLRPEPTPPAAEPPARPRDAPRFRVETEEDGFVQARREDLARRRLAELRAGRMPHDREIDLHGLSARDARQALLAGLAEARRSGERCVLVIHGAGLHSQDAPVLRQAVPGWILEGPVADEVLALCTAPRRHGGPGATRVLLRRDRTR